LLSEFGLEGLLTGLLLGHSLLFFSFFYTIIRQYPGDISSALISLAGARFSPR